MAVLVVCVGNRLVPEDSLGPEVHDWLSLRRLPREVELVDGGVRGLDLLGAVERARHVVFVDAVAGLGPAGEVLVVDGPSAARAARSGFGHDGGLEYLLGCLPHVCEGEPPGYCLVGAEGPADAALVARVGERALELAAAAAARAGALSEPAS
jgi:hydrogenase maturation protease